MTNAEFAKKDQVFRKACEIANANLPKGQEPGIEPTKRQASKWRNRRGMAYRFRGTAASVLKRSGS